MIDALSEVLRVVGLTGGVFLDAEFTEPWCVAGKVGPDECRAYMAEPQQLVCFHYVIDGGFQIRTESGETRMLGPGQAVLLPRNPIHILGSDATLPPVAVTAMMKAPPSVGLPQLAMGGGGARTRLVCGFLGGNEQLNLLVEALPELMTIDVKTMPGGDWMAHSFSYAARTLAEGDPGAATILTKLSELLFVEALRHYLAGLPPTETGWLAGLRDPSVGRALGLMHARSAEPWTSEALAREVGLSRSAFADRFSGIVGEPPMRYLTRWRLRRAAEALQNGRRSIAQIAHDVGYEAEEAFTRAFRREYGAPPAAWRRQASA